MELPFLQEDAVLDHIYDLYTDRAPNQGQNLGYVDRTKDSIQILLPDAQIDLEIRQSISSLSSKTQTSSTGFICWQTALLIADWVLSDAKCPLRKFIFGNTVLELGTGVSSLLASTLGPLCKHYIASDQKHLLKLMKVNFDLNVVTRKFSSSTVELGDLNDSKLKKQKESLPKIDFIELDWENYEQGLYTLDELTGRTQVDVVIACDTIYNSYLISHFLKTTKSVMGPGSVAIVALQLRDETVLEAFLFECFDQGFQVQFLPDEILSSQLNRGFTVYCLFLKS